MENQKKWAGWLIAALVVAVGVVAVVMSTGTAEPPAATQTPAVTASPMASGTPAPTASAAQSGMRTANASVLGYAGPVLVRLTLDANGAISSLDVGGARFEETVGVGSRVREEEFTAQFIGKTPPLTLGEDIDGISGATVSSQAAVDAVNEAAARFRDLGAAEINLNFGCPSRQVTSGGAGGGALRHPDALLRMVERVKSFLPDLPLSVKLRTGWNSPEEARHLLPALARTGVLDRVFLHFRTVSEGYAPTEGREARLVAAIADLGAVPCIVNGDLRSAEEARTLAAATGASGVMAARGWLRDPWLLRRIAGETELPDVETGRQRFFAEVLSDGFRCCRAIELSQFLWGRDNPWFNRLRRLPPGATVGPELFR